MDNLNVFSELLVIGLIGLIALALNFIGIYDIKFETLKIYIDLFKGYNTTILVLILASSYFLGCFLNKVSRFMLASYFYKKNIKALLPNNVSGFGEIRDYVYLKMSDSTAEKIKERISTIRMLRSGIIISLLFSFGFISVNKFFLSSILLVLSIIFTIFTFFSYKDYVSNIINTYKALERG